MPARKKTAAVTTGIGAPNFLIENWPAIEKACKFKTALPKPACDDIQERTRRYLWLQKMEAEAISVADQASDLKKIAKATEELRRHLMPLNDAVAVSIPTDDEVRSAFIRNTQASRDAHQATLRRDIDRGFQIMHRLESCFDEVILSRSADVRRPFRNFAQEMRILCNLLASLENAANKALGKKRHEANPQLEGDAWNHWIVEIYTILTNYGLPATTSNDTDKRSVVATKTPFVRLVDELQTLLPDAAKRHTHSKSGLAKAMQRAIEKVRRPSRRKAA